MIKMLVGFFIGIVLMGALLLGPLNPSSSTHAEPGGIASPSTSLGVTPSSASVTIPESDLAALNIRQLLTNAGENIQSPDTRAYYQSLMNRYDINSIPDPSVETLTTNPLKLLPDMNKVTSAAMTMPLESAGQQITDPEIKQFYYQLLNDSGWNINDKSQ